MGITIKRTRDASTGSVTTLNLADADAADRRFEVAPSDGLSKGGARFFGFMWAKSAAEAVTVTVSLIDGANSSKEYVLEGPTNDGGATTGLWTPPGWEAVAGRDARSPDATGLTYRLQFSQAGGACTADVIAHYKEV